MTQSKRILFLLAVFATALAACTPAAPGDGVAGSALIFSPEDGAQYALGELVMVTTGLLQESGAISATLLVNGVPERVDDLDTPLSEGSMFQGWRPSAEGSYTLQTSFLGADGSLVASDSITVQVGPADLSAEPSEEPSEPTPTPTITPTPEDEDPTATGDVDGNCRVGPGTIYDVIGTLLQGETALVVGRSQPAGWWQIENPDANGSCWIADSVIQVSGPTDELPLIAIPPTPTPTPTATATTASAPAAPPTPVQTSPSTDLKCTSSVDLVWQPVSHSVSIDYYQWQLQWYDGYGWNLSDEGQTGGSSQNVVLSCDRLYRWRVRAVDANGAASPYSGYLEFENLP